MEYQCLLRKLSTIYYSNIAELAQEGTPNCSLLQLYTDYSVIIKVEMAGTVDWEIKTPYDTLTLSIKNYHIWQTQFSKHFCNQPNGEELTRTTQAGKSGIIFRQTKYRLIEQIFQNTDDKIVKYL